MGLITVDNELISEKEEEVNNQKKFGYIKNIDPVRKNGKMYPMYPEILYRIINRDIYIYICA